MGREGRQARRQGQSRQTRRQQQRRQQAQQQQGISRASMIGGGLVIVAVLLVLGALTFGSHTFFAAAKPTATVGPGKTIAGIQCNSMEQATYHVHSHLDMYYQGKHEALPAYVGFNINHDCLYWTHTHDTTGVIHVEAPKKLAPTLGDFFRVWGQPLSSKQFESFKVGPGQQERVWVNDKPYPGDPSNIRLTSHKSITIEIGPPWVTPHLFDFKAANLPQ